MALKKRKNAVKEISGASDYLFYALVYLLAAIAFAITLYPYLYVLSVSISDSRAAFEGKVFLWPVGFSLEGYKSVLSEANLWVAYGNTLYYTAVGTVFNIVATTLAAYPLSRRSFVARRPLNFLIAFTMYFSGGLIPSYLLITGLGLYNSRWVMILPVLVSTSNMMICRSAFSSIPEEVIESAYIDGANDMQLYWHIAIRLIVPTLAVLTLYYAVGHWNSYFNAMLYLSKPKLQPLQLLLRRVLLAGLLRAQQRRGIRRERRGRLAAGAIRYHRRVHPAHPVLLSLHPEVLHQGRHARRGEGVRENGRNVGETLGRRLF